MVMLEAGSGRTDPGTNCYNESWGDATCMQRQWQEGAQMLVHPDKPVSRCLQLSEFATQLSNWADS